MYLEGIPIIIIYYWFGYIDETLRNQDSYEIRPKFSGKNKDQKID